MLAAQQSGKPFVKAEHNRIVQAATGRSRGSVEFKFCNVSAVLRDLGRVWVDGYLPRSNYQSALGHEVRDFLVRAFEPQEVQTKGEEAVGGGMRGAAEGPDDLPTLYLEDLWERATGGTAVAVSPTHDGKGAWPIGPSVVGADEVVDQLLEGLQSREPALQSLVFLIGGPGNGKSALARRVSAELRMEGAPSPHLAHRTYRYSTPSGAPLVVLNDATIPGGEETAPQGQLVQDIRSALEEGASLLANINRGVLHEELAFCRFATETIREGAGAAEGILMWLGDVAAGLGDDGSGGIQPIRKQERQDQVQVLVVLMDVCSLLEKRPIVAREPGGVRLVEEYSVSRLTKRHELPLERVPAGVLLDEFHRRLDPALRQAPDWHPVRANLEALDSESVRSGVLCLLRAAELAASRRFSYREMWGAYVRAVVGELPERINPAEAVRLLAVGIPGEDTPHTRFSTLAALADLRLHQSLVGAVPFGQGPMARQPRPPTKNPVLRLTRRVDPALDATPEWCKPVIESMAFPDEDHSPLNTLLARDDVEGLASAVTKFDRLLDASYVSVVRANSEIRHAAVESWYGGYLLRLFAVATARPAFLVELDLWTQAWAQKGWPKPLKEALRTLLFPRHTKDSEMLLPVLEARAHPVVGTTEEPRLVRVIETHNTNFSRVRRGESLFVALGVGEGNRAELELDFDLLREALACVDGELGLSDRARATLPRLERFRANLLRPELDFDYAMVQQTQESPIDLEQP